MIGAALLQPEAAGALRKRPALPLSGAYAIAIIEPFADGGTPLSRPCTIDDTPPVKSISARSACASAVGSSVASVVPAATDGLLLLPSEKLVLSTPVKLMKVGSVTDVSVDTRVLGATDAQH